jgi:hypothetical protein
MPDSLTQACRERYIGLITSFLNICSRRPGDIEMKPLKYRVLLVIFWSILIAAAPSVSGQSGRTVGEADLDKLIAAGALAGRLQRRLGHDVYHERRR